MGELQAADTCLLPLHISHFLKYTAISGQLSSGLHIVVLF